MADPLLEAYLAAGDDAAADVQLGRLLDEEARPVVRRVVESVLREAYARDVEDLVADTIADLLRRLRDVRAAGDREAIQDLRSYVVTAAYNRCRERLRERAPARNRLRNHLQYLCGHDPRFALWRTARGVLLCGLRAWNGSEASRDDRAAGVSLPARSDPTAEDRAQIGALVQAVFREVGGPLELDTLVAAIARQINLETQRLEVPLTSRELARATPADDALELRLSLRDLWNDVRQLSVRQRVALLLNLRDVHGRECLSLLPLTDTASVDEIADAVAIPRARFAALWNDLPLTDLAIGELLGATGRQVIKLRRLARERLTRMAARRANPKTNQNLGVDSDSSPADLTATRGRIAR